MHNSEDILVYSSFAIMVIMLILIGIFYPVTFWHTITGKGPKSQFTLEKLPLFLAVIFSSTLALFIYGLLISRSISLTLYFVGLTEAIIAISCFVILLNKVSDD